MKTIRKPVKVNYRSASTKATLAKHEQIRSILRWGGEGVTIREIADALGISRQLALYHVKKMVAAFELVMVLEPCKSNAGVQYRVWDEMALARRYAGMLRIAA